MQVFVSQILLAQVINLTCLSSLCFAQIAPCYEKYQHTETGQVITIGFESAGDKATQVGSPEADKGWLR